jgi:hypothetical protein
MSMFQDQFAAATDQNLNIQVLVCDLYCLNICMIDFKAERPCRNRIFCYIYWIVFSVSIYLAIWIECAIFFIWPCVDTFHFMCESLQVMQEHLWEIQHKTRTRVLTWIQVFDNAPLLLKLRFSLFSNKYKCKNVFPTNNTVAPLVDGVIWSVRSLSWHWTTGKMRTAWFSWLLWRNE